MTIGLAILAFILWMVGWSMGMHDADKLRERTEEAEGANE